MSYLSTSTLEIFKSHLTINLYSFALDTTGKLCGLCLPFNGVFISNIVAHAFMCVMYIFGYLNILWIFYLIILMHFAVFLCALEFYGIVYMCSTLVKCAL